MIPRISAASWSFAAALILSGCLAETDLKEPEELIDAGMVAGGDTGVTSAGDTGTNNHGDDAMTSDASADSGVTDPDSGIVIPELDCTPKCTDVSTEVGQARCYACQCKKAMDGWLPTHEEMQCERGREIVIYTQGANGTLEPVDDARAECANPALLTGACSAGGRLGQILHGDITAKWICRRSEYTQPNVRATTAYSDQGAIIHNNRTGATCYWDDRDNVTFPNQMPGLDIVDASDSEIETWLQVFYNTEGGSCTTCHDADPFIYTPYLQSVGWVALSYQLGPYARITTENGVVPIGSKTLMSPEAGPCLRCHRISNRNGCETFARDSMGLDKAAPYEASVIAAAANPGDDWKLAYWMPFQTPVTSFAAWQSEFGAAKEKIVHCCRSSIVGQNTFHDDGSPDCIWQDVPATH